MESPGRNKNNISLNISDIKNEYKGSSSLNRSGKVGDQSILDESFIMTENSIMADPLAKSTPKKGLYGGRKKTKRCKRGGVKIKKGNNTRKIGVKIKKGNNTRKIGDKLKPKINTTTIVAGKYRPNNRQNAGNLMNMLHDNVKHTMGGGLNREKPHSQYRINKAFKSLIGKPGTNDAQNREEAFYQALSNKRQELDKDKDVRKAMWREAMIHQELPYGLHFNKQKPCKYGKKCKRLNPIHKLMYHRKCNQIETCAPTIVANVMYDPVRDR